MLILVAVSIQIAIQSGLFEKAGKATQDWQTAQDAEGELGAGKVNIGGTIYDSIDEYLQITEKGSSSKVISKDKANNTKLNSNNVKEVVQTKTATTTYEAPIPVGFTVSGIESEQSIVDGLVIYDIPSSVDTSRENFWTETVTVGDQTYPKVQTEYNQFVWVPVETAYVKKSDLEKIISDSNGSITTEKAAMQSLVDNGTYPMAVQLANGTDYRGILYSFSAGTNGVKIEVRDFSSTANYNDGSVTYYREPAQLSRTNSYVDQTKEPALDLQTEYNNIVKSVASQKGFWVARYELSYSTKGESKRGKAVATAEDTNTNQWYGLYTACQGMYPSSEITGTKSSMIYGSEWDQIMIWMKDVKNTQDNTKYYILDSSYMGNYNTATGGTGGPQVTGYLEKYSVKKVFDLGGNLYDWTTEATDTSRRVLRGGYYDDRGSSAPASIRGNNRPTRTGSGNSARSALYVTL